MNNENKCKKNGEYCDSCFDRGYKEGWDEAVYQLIQLSKEMQDVKNNE